MRGVGGPLLCIGDLLSDLAEKHEDDQPHPPPSSSSSPLKYFIFLTVRLNFMFQENYEQLNQALEGSDPAWTLCTAVETGNKLVQSTNSNARLLSEKVAEMEKVVKRGDSAVAAAKVIPITLGQKGRPQTNSPTPEAH
ncbi:unnamed protein product [Linum tenue]|uniref:Uncharacterized protein n=1 Tax=Linum tenue TaxID=586396 RepID=A0AAV0LB03_9ROSI|nr:unnamed protein product [Linum tenue]CAI0430815.1 unnamed protein product [Linum tenue]